MKRLFWIALGASAGVLVVRQLRSTASSLTPGVLAGSLGGRVRDFVGEVKLGMAERELELRTTLGLDGSADVIDAHTLRH